MVFLLINLLSVLLDYRFTECIRSASKLLEYRMKNIQTAMSHYAWISFNVSVVNDRWLCYEKVDDHDAER